MFMLPVNNLEPRNSFAGQAKWKKTLVLAFQAIGIIYGEASASNNVITAV